LLISTGLILFLLAATDGPSLLRLKDYLQQFRGPDFETGVPLGPYLRAGAQIVLFYVLLGLALGAILHVAARVLASERGGDGTWVIPRRRFYAVFIAALLVVTAYMHIHALLVYPALYDSSWRWAALAGSPTVVTVFGLLGKFALIAVGLVLLHKRRDEVSRWFRRRAWGVLIVVVVVGGGAVGARLWLARPKNINQGPNIIILGLDSVRPDHVSGFGYPRKTTPNLDRFMRDSIAFTNAFIPLARTGPSWMTVLTGCYPTKHGQRDDMAPKESRLPPVATLAAHLEKLGYRSSFFTDNTNFAWMDPEIGFSYIGQPRPNVVWFGLSYFPLHLVLYYYCLNNPLGFCYAPMLRENQAFTSVYDLRYFARAIERRLARMKGEGKFFLAAHTCIVHAPFATRYPYSTYFSPPRPTPTNRFAFRWPFDKILSRKESERRSAGAEWPRLFLQEVNLYDALVRQTDDWLGEVLDSIRRLGLYDDSLIVVFADHGEDLFRGDLVYDYIASNHGFHVWGDTGYHVPLAIKMPKSKGAGRQVPSLVRSIDIAPTALDALGLPPLPDAEGVSLVPQIEDPSRDPRLSAYLEAGLSLDMFFITGHRPYPFEHWLLFQYVEPETLKIYRKEEYMPGFVMAKDRALRDRRWKIIAYPMKGDPVPFRTSLHDVERDPTNYEDYSTSEPLVSVEMRSRLAPFIDRDAQKYGFRWRWQDEATTKTPTTAPPQGAGKQ
jgi:arylsulfatase A-like enzyme